LTFGWQTLLSAIFPALVIVAALKDATSFTIPNWISLALLAAFAPVALACGVALPQIAVALGVGVAALLAGMAMFACGWIGGGDAKLLAASALWLGWPAVLPFVLVTALCGGALALALLGLRSVWLQPITVRGPAWVGRLATPGAAAPYGVAICAGALATFPSGVVTQAISLLR
jgi:prepilin peptidase CpaA